jgi:dodecin
LHRLRRSSGHRAVGKSLDDAVEQGLLEASRTIDNVKEIWVSGFKEVVENNKIVECRLNAKVTFLVKRDR